MATNNLPGPSNVKPHSVSRTSIEVEYVYLTCTTCKTQNKHINIDIPTTEYFCNNTCQWKKQQQEARDRANKSKSGSHKVMMFNGTNGRSNGFLDDYF